MEIYRIMYSSTYTTSKLYFQCIISFQLASLYLSVTTMKSLLVGNTMYRMARLVDILKKKSSHKLPGTYIRTVLKL